MIRRLQTAEPIEHRQLGLTLINPSGPVGASRYGEDEDFRIEIVLTDVRRVVEVPGK